MDVLTEILKWSSQRPMWQRDALRRLVAGGSLEEPDMEDLLAICKSAHGLAENQKAVPLGECHIPHIGSSIGVVRLSALTHHGGVNALAEEQTIEFGPNLTVIYGANAAGKSGYSRILKRACRARGAEEVLGNVLSESESVRPRATIRYTVGTEKHEFAWHDQDQVPAALGHVSVFDSHCAAIYLRKKTDVAFRPFGLELFDKLSDACGRLQKALAKERKELESVKGYLPRLPHGTAAHRVVSNITPLTDRDEVRRLGTFSAPEKEKLRQVRNRQHDLRAGDPERTASSLTLHAQRVETLSTRLTEIKEVLAEHNVKPVFEARDAVEKAHQAAQELRATTFSPHFLPGTGSALWRELWEAAERFSVSNAYPESEFPVTDDLARCVLCQQNLGREAKERFKDFLSFLQSNAQRDLVRLRAAYHEKLNRLEGLALSDQLSLEVLEELRLEESNSLADSIHDHLASSESYRDEILKALLERGAMPGDAYKFELDVEEVLTEAQSLRDRSDLLLKVNTDESAVLLDKQSRELEASKILGGSIEHVYEEIHRKSQIAAYQMCLQDTLTHSITRKSTEITTEVATQQLASRFGSELKRLRLEYLEIELQAVGGDHGTLYHKVVLKRAKGVSLPQVASEGEARALSIAAFFAELSTADERSTILFDDPVSSLDHMWRDNVAHRLAEEAVARQVVVFTHDVVFLLALDTWAKKFDVLPKHQHLQREVVRIGVCTSELPWGAMGVSKRIGVLKDNHQRVTKLYRSGRQTDYEKEAVDIYRLLRTAWEQGVEEVLLEGVVQRYRQSIQTLRAKHLADISEDDCRALEAGMTKCSRWLHDLAAAENPPVPDPGELGDDILALENWVKAIRTRRKNKHKR